MLQHEGDDHVHPSRRRLQTMDLISDLPDPIIHHIMSFLTTLDVTTLSILSRRFFSLWASFPVIDFDESRFSRSYHGSPAFKTDAFLDHVLNSVFLRSIKIAFEEFRVKANLSGVVTDRRFDLVIQMVLANGVKCMELNLGFAEYILPTDFASKSINVLKLKGLQLDLCNLIRVCPLLKTVCLKSCVILHDVKFSSKTLTEIELHYCDVKLIKIDAPNLRLFIFRSGKLNPQFCEIDVLKCQNLTYLSLNNIANGGDWIEEHVYCLSKLNTFLLNRCRDIERIRVWNDNLERVELARCPMLTSIELRAKSLEYFTYKKARFGNVCNTLTFFGTNSMKDLWIKGAACVTDQWLESYIARMEHLESLKLLACGRLSKIKLAHEKLQTLELDGCNGLTEADINAPRLVSFVYQGEVIERGGALITDQWLEAQLAKMTSLESLRLKECNSLKKIKILHERLKILELYNCNGLVEAEIDTPHLVSFMYHGKIIEVRKMVTGSNCVATLSMNRWATYDNETFYRWIKLLSFFGHCKTLQLICNTPKEVMIPELHRERLVSPLFDLQHLEIQIKSLEKIDRDLVDSLLWLSPLPQTLHISSSGSPSQLQMIIKLVYMVEEGEEDKNPLCCGTKPIKCWKHYLKRVEIQSSDLSSKDELLELKSYFLSNAKMSGWYEV